MTNFFAVRKLTLYALLCLLIVITNVIWALMTHVELWDNSHQKVEELSTIDKVMFHINVGLQFVAFYAILISGPVDICRIQLLKDNVRIYGFLMCTTVSITKFIESILVDVYWKEFYKLAFAIDRIILIILSLASIGILSTIVREELDSLG